MASLSVKIARATVEEGLGLLRQASRVWSEVPDTGPSKNQGSANLPCFHSFTTLDDTGMTAAMSFVDINDPLSVLLVIAGMLHCQTRATLFEVVIPTGAWGYAFDVCDNLEQILKGPTGPVGNFWSKDKQGHQELTLRYPGNQSALVGILGLVNALQVADLQSVVAAPDSRLIVVFHGSASTVDSLLAPDR